MGKYNHIYVKRELMGIAMNNIMVEKSQAMEWLEQLDE